MWKKNYMAVRKKQTQWDCSDLSLKVGEMVNWKTQSSGLCRSGLSDLVARKKLNSRLFLLSN